MAYSIELHEIDQEIAQQDDEPYDFERAIKLAIDLSNSALDGFAKGQVNSASTVEFLAYAIDRFADNDLNQRMVAAVITGNLTRIVAISEELKAYLDDWSTAEAKEKLA